GFGMLMKDIGVRVPSGAERIERYGMKPTKLYWGVGYVTDVTNVTSEMESSPRERGDVTRSGNLSSSSVTSVTSVTEPSSDDGDDFVPPLEVPGGSAPRPPRRVLR